MNLFKKKSNGFLSPYFLRGILIILFLPPFFLVGQSLLSPHEIKSIENSEVSKIPEDNRTFVLSDKKISSQKRIQIAFSEFRKKNYKKTISILENIPRTGDKKILPKFSELRNLLLFESYLQTGLYSRIVDLTRTHKKNYTLNALVLFNYNYALHKLSKPIKFTEFVSEDTFNELNRFDPSRTNFFRKILFEDAIRRKDYYRAMDFFSDANGILLYKYFKDFEAVTEKIQDADVLDELIQRTHSEDIKRNFLIQKIQILFKNKKQKEAEQLLQKIKRESADTLNSAQKLKIAYLSEYLSVKNGNRPLKIGVLLPFSEKRLKYLTEQVMKGLLLAFKENENSKIPLELIFADTAGDPFTAKQQAINLIEEKKVAAIIGPLVKNTSVEVFRLADIYKIPVISLSQTDNLGKKFRFGYRFNFSLEEEATSLADYAIDYLGARNFAILFPNNSQGVQKSIFFWKEVEKKGGNLLSFEKIPPRIQDLNSVFRRLSGNYRFLSSRDNAENIDTKAISTKSQKIDAIYIPSDYTDLKTLSDFIKAYSLSHAYILTDDQIAISQIYGLDNRRRLINARVFYDDEPFNRFYNSYWKNFHYLEYYLLPQKYTFYAYMSLNLIAEVIERNEALIPSEIKRGIERRNYSKIKGIEVILKPSGDFKVPISILSGRGNLSRIL